MADIDQDSFKTPDDLQLDAMPEPVGPDHEGGGQPRLIWLRVALVAVLVALIGAAVWYWRRPEERRAEKPAEGAPVPAL